VARYCGFFPGSQGRLFVTLYLPDHSRLPLRWLLHLPAFTDEMNKSRAIVAQQARQLAEQGWAVLIPDLYGCGDSAGDLSAARWPLWQQDLCKLISLLQELGVERLSLWGLRLGCLLVSPLLRSSPLIIERIILWQPVLDGQRAMTQFLRLRAVAGLTGGATETLDQLREYLQCEQQLEVAGYNLPLPLLVAIESESLMGDADLIALSARDQPLSVEWLEVARQPERGLLPASKVCIEAWQAVGVQVAARQVVGDGFWAAQELVEVPALLQATTEALCHGYVAEEKTEERGEEKSGGKAAGHTSRPVTELLGSLFSCSSLAEQPIDILCLGHSLQGLLHRPTVAIKPATRGVLVVVGGPQYRVGSHRQFLLLARHLASAGIPVLRFDYRGMGDSPAGLRGFQHIDEDISAALSAFQQQQPQLTEFVLWGLCDGATAGLKFAARDTRVSGLVLLNPWVHSEKGAARVELQHYYWRRLYSVAFWRGLVGGRVNVPAALAALWRLFGKARSQSPPHQSKNPLEEIDLVRQWVENLQAFEGRVLLLVSGRDLTAREFDLAVAEHPSLRRLLLRPAVTRVDMSEADHTFSRREWRDEAAERTRRWLQSW